MLAQSHFQVFNFLKPSIHQLPSLSSILEILVIQKLIHLFVYSMAELCGTVLGAGNQ